MTGCTSTCSPPSAAYSSTARYSILGALGFYFVPRRREMVSEGLLLAACFVGFLIPYAMWYNAVGGEAFGQRFLIPAIPFLLLPSGFLIEAKKPGVAAVAYLLYGVGVVFNGIAGVTFAIPQQDAVSHFPFLTTVLPLFLKGQLDTWWWREAGSGWWAPALLIIATALVLPWVDVPSVATETTVRPGSTRWQTG